ncbi:MAG: trypsin-like peptidase domain-containing protein [Abitibacteriaceae bacterium]|nr:trypsin-like peptidase domain-containing protein [Abditibacteriaceae bacterium]
MQEPLPRPESEAFAGSSETTTATEPSPVPPVVNGARHDTLLHNTVGDQEATAFSSVPEAQSSTENGGVVGTVAAHSGIPLETPAAAAPNPTPQPVAFQPGVAESAVTAPSYAPLPDTPLPNTPLPNTPLPQNPANNWGQHSTVITASAPVREPIAPEVMRPPATNPFTMMLIGGVLACALIGLGMFLQSLRGHTGPLDPISYVGTTSSESGNAIVEAVRRVGPAVLNVDSRFGKSGPSDFLPDPGSDAQPREGKGTGVIINSKRGLMLTNAHVVAGAQKIQVMTRDGDVYTGRIIGTDRMSDVAVVEVSSKSLPEAKLAPLKNSRDLAIGQWAIAIGNPFAQANTVTVGVVSATGRAIPVPGRNGSTLQLTDMIQTDAAINPGNSGGPLCNIRGEVIGINTAIYGIGTGLGFSIPINKAKAVADQLISKGKVSHPYIGIHMTSVTDALKTDMGLPDPYGALVQAVEPKSPAAQAQIQVGDTIRSVDGRKMKSSEDVQRYVGGKSVGDVIKIDIVRNSTVKKTLTLKIGDRPDTSDEPVAPAQK